ncbi:MAG: nicotinate phosphoribosyltransferase, partial [Planctomycetota bacterium]
DLDEHKIERLRGDGAMINLWGVGTNLVTAADQPALGGVYKLAAIQDDHGDWTDRIKRSDDPEKASIPGIQQVRRFERDGKWSRDVIFDPRVGLPDSESVSGDEVVSVDELLQPMMKHGRLTADLPSLQEIREHAIRERKRLPPEVRRLSCSTTETVQLAEHLRQRRIAMMENAV